MRSTIKGCLKTNARSAEGTESMPRWPGTLRFRSPVAERECFPSGKRKAFIANMGELLPIDLISTEASLRWPTARAP
jgi:ribosomal protein L32E